MTLQAGDWAPDLNVWLPDEDGVELNIGHALLAGPVLLGIYKSSCAASKAMMPILNRFVVAYSEGGLSVFGVSQDSENVTRSFIRRTGVDYPILIEGDDFPLSRAFDIFATPSIYVIRSNGSIAYMTMGFLKSQIDEISQAVAGTLGASEIPIISAADEEIPLFVPG